MVDESKLNPNILQGLKKVAQAVKDLVNRHNTSDSAHSNLFYTKTEIDNIIGELEEDMVS